METAGGSIKRILVVEDEPAIGKMCQRVLSIEGFKADIAVNGKSAQEAINRKQYDLCLFDIRTPGMSGRDLYQWVKQEKTELLKGIIFTSGDTISEDTQAFLEQAGRPFLPKPFSVGDLMTAVKQALKAIGK